jgi:hypothetical protein
MQIDHIFIRDARRAGSRSAARLRHLQRGKIHDFRPTLPLIFRY